MKKRRIALLSSIIALSTLAISFSSFSLAKYVEGKKTDQSGFGLGGERKVSIFFNANIWKQGKDSSGNIVDASFYLYAWHHNDSTGVDTLAQTLIPSAHVTPTISGTIMDLFVYEYDTTTLNRFIFLRWDPTVTPSTDIDYGDGRWNKTVDLTYSSTYNYYCIDAWGPEEFSGGPSIATPNKNKINKEGNSLVWGNP